MYSDIRSKNSIKILAALILILLVLLVFWIFRDSGRDIGDESALAIQQTVEREALQCYAVEGVYPPDLEYLENNYGLQINTEDFYVTYDVFASNMPPTVIVTPRHHGEEAGS